MDALAENGQYMPFDPVLAAAGATLGGTIASGVVAGRTACSMAAFETL